MKTEAGTLQEKWKNLISEQPEIRPRNAARQLGVSECELLACRLGEMVTLLKPEFENILKELQKIGKFKAITRNEDCILHQTGFYPDINSKQLESHEEILNVKFIFSEWKNVFAVKDENEKSLQFFDRSGSAVHKVYLTSESNEEAFDLLVKKFKTEDSNLNTEMINPISEQAMPDVDVKEFHQAWKELEDFRNFEKLLHIFGMSRLQALQLAPDAFFARKIRNRKAVVWPEDVIEQEIFIRMEVGNRGCIQTCMGQLQQIFWHGTWLNAGSENFGLHLDSARIDSTWIVRIPTAWGIISSIEIYNPEEELTARIFGFKEDGQPESGDWRKLLARYEK